MKSIWEIPFIVVDVETTGGNPINERIIDIGCVTTVGGEIISTYSSLVNPHQFIPPFISKMTGISNEMVFNASEAEEVFNEVKTYFKQNDAVFVAHNAQFDWAFVLNTFLRCNLEPPELKRLCTLKLSRRLLKKNLKKNVGSLANYFNITVNGRHRALGDALATAQILIEMLDIAEREHNISTVEELLKFQNKKISNYKTPLNVFKRLEDQLQNLPDEPGVYYFLDKYKNILYIGKAKSLKDRVNSYFNNEPYTSRKISEMLKLSHFIVWETTGTELSALIKESSKIKEIKPPYNSLDKRDKSYPFIKITLADKFPRVELTFEVDDDSAEYFGPFSSSIFVKEIIESIDKRFKLIKCDNPLSPNIDYKNCFYYQIDRCNAPCSELITRQEYLDEVQKVKYFLGGFSDGIVRQLESKMTELSENLDFEKAFLIKNQIIELKKLFQKKNLFPVSVNNNNVIIIHKSDSIEKFDCLFIQYGKLVSQICVNSSNDQEDTVQNLINNIYFNGQNGTIKLNKQESNELRIINSWVYRNQSACEFIYINGDDSETVFNQFKEKINLLMNENTDSVDI
ncbi:MAG: DEDD exonuclease domain-containing protein [Candidatus Kapabacteria bacterium]|nr:DEDD exonuclease domain-containing protein [Candidatus Kapabacteria bacterium]